MAIKVNISLYLQRFTNGQDVVEVNGRTVGECLHQLVKVYLGLEKELFNQYGELDDYVGVYVNREMVCSWEKPLTILVHDGDELSIIPMNVGGG